MLHVITLTKAFSVSIVVPYALTHGHVTDLEIC